MPTIEEQLDKISAVVNQQNDSKLDTLISNVKALQEDKSKNSGFEKIIKLLTAALIPLAIALAGHLFGKQIKSAEIASQENRSNAELSFQKEKNSTAEKQQKAEMILKFMSELSSADPVRKQIALQAISIALPDEGPRFVEIVLKNDTDPEVKQKAKEIYQDASQKLIDSVFSNNKEQRIAATGTLLNSYSNNLDVYKRIIERAKTDSNADGVYNSTLILANASKLSLEALQPEVQSLKTELDRKGFSKSKASLQNRVINRMQ